MLRLVRRAIEIHINTDQVGLVELEAAGILQHQLVDAMQPLEEHGRALVGILATERVAAAITKLVTEVQPLALDQRAETLTRTNIILLAA